MAQVSDAVTWQTLSEGAFTYGFALRVSTNKAEMAVLPNQMGILFRRTVFKPDTTVVSVSPAALK